MEVSLTEEVSGGVTYRGEWRCHLQRRRVEVSLTEEASGGVTYRGGEWRCHLQRR